MPLKKAGAVVILVVVFLALLIAFIVLPEALPEATSQNAMFHVLVRLFGLYGYLFLAIATLTTPFLKEVTQAFGRPFLRVHHVFSVLGLILITLHPVSDACGGRAYWGSCRNSVHGGIFGGRQADPLFTSYTLGWSPLSCVPRHRVTGDLFIG